ncbi:terpene synthase family protein [Streptomyces laurentii]|uniref:terpene synthase family protein n=1 Tax=Streptomyces laurentii TaxID=39478 RepID=UPI0036965F6B
METEAPLSLPALTYPYPRRIHPDTDQAEEAMLSWLGGHGLIRQPAVLEAFRYTRFAGMIGHQYPDADSDGLRVVSEFCGWIFIMDDYVCDSGVFGRRVGDLAVFCAWMRDILENPGQGGHDPLGDAATSGVDSAGRDFCFRIARAAAECFEMIAARATPAQYMRFVSEMDYYFHGVMWEARHHAAGTVPTPEEYRIGRRMTCGAPFALALQDIAAGYEVPANEYQHPEVRALRLMTANINSWCDDIFSYGKESEVQEATPLNLPLTLIHHRGLGEQAALDETARLHNAEVDRYLTAEAHTAMWAGEQLTRLLAAMRTMQRGFYDWGLETPRYNVGHYFRDLPDAAGDTSLTPEGRPVGAAGREP